MPPPPQVLQRVWFVGFAGHRGVPDRAAAKAVISRELKTICGTVSGELVGISSAAAGADLLFLDACREAGLKTVVLLPFPKERFQEDFGDPADWEHACRCMDDAWWCEVSPGGEGAPAAYHVVARESLEVADRMLFLWDGQPARGIGGTGETVREAKEREIPSRIIDANTLQASWNGDEPDRNSRDPDFEDLPSAASIEDLFQKLDDQATKGAPRSRYFAAGSMSLNHVATILQVVLVTWFLTTESGAMVKLLIATFAALLPWVGGRLRWQERWIRDRVRAELLRSLLSSHEPGSPLRPPAVELFGREAAFLRTAALHLVKNRQGWEAARDAYMNERIDGQIGYLKSKGELAARKMAIYGRLFWFASWSALILGGYVVISAWLDRAPGPPWNTPLGLATGALPGIAAWCLAMISVFEFKRRASLYRQLVDELKRLRPKIATANCASAVAGAMNQIERLLLNELWEWQGSRKK
ncbi:MAG: hypothetical protein ABIS50_13135 [Luteolibacter sp.]|uniref:hypothetical protein n=1 Tax=Luteolibacter sp. TaxID=1962973 RepID=UPI00326476A6